MRPSRSAWRLVAAVALAATYSLPVVAGDAGAFNAAYGFSSQSQARTAVPSATSLGGTASFGLSVNPRFVIAGATQTFTSSVTPGSPRTWGYGVTKFEFNGDQPLIKATADSDKSLDFQVDYTLVLPTNSGQAPGAAHYDHQFLGMVEYQHSSQNYFEVDFGDYMNRRATGSGYQHTALLSLVQQRNLAQDGSAKSNYDFELDVSPASGGAPASAVFTAGADHSFHSGLALTVLANAGLTANDAMIGVTIRLKFSGKLGGTPAKATRSLSFSKLQRLEKVRFGRIGRF